MSATTITGYSTELNQGPPGSPQTYQPLKPNQHQGRVRMASFSLTLASQVSGTSFAVMIVPKGARIISGGIIASATLANSATLAVGLAGAPNIGGVATGNIDDTATGVATVTTAGAASTGSQSDAVACLKAAAVQSTTFVGFALTQALAYLYEVQKDCFITLTTGTGTVATEKVTGHVFYSLD